MKLLFISGLVALILALVTSASATEASTGPYSVSFDLKTAADPTVSVSGPLEGAQSSQYYLSIKANNTTEAGIGITSYKNWQDANSSEVQVKEALMRALAKAGEIANLTVIERIIDGSKAVVQSYTASLIGANVTMATYWKDSQAVEGYSHVAGKTKVEILSKLPKDLTENLLSTLSIKVTSNESVSPVADNVTPVVDESVHAATDDSTEAAKSENVTFGAVHAAHDADESKEMATTENATSTEPQVEVEGNASTEMNEAENATLAAPQADHDADESKEMATTENATSTEPQVEAEGNASTEMNEAENATLAAPQVADHGNESSKAANGASSEVAITQNVSSTAVQAPVAGNESAEAPGAENATANATIEDNKSAFTSNELVVEENRENLAPEVPQALSQVSAVASNELPTASDKQTIVPGMDNTTIVGTMPDSTGPEDEKLNDTCMQQWVGLGYTRDMIKFIGYCTEEG